MLPDPRRNPHRPSRPSGRRGPRRLPFHRSRPPIRARWPTSESSTRARVRSPVLLNLDPSGVSPGSAWSGRRRSLRQGRTGRSCASCEQLCVRLTAAIDRERLLDECPYNGIPLAGSGRSGVVFPSRPAATPTRTRSRPFASEGGASCLRRTWTGPRDDGSCSGCGSTTRTSTSRRPVKIVVTRASRSTKASD